jgi:ribosomal protein S18 acetylase RimI-like enzyme
MGKTVAEQRIGTLADGTNVLVRPLLPEDKECLAAGFSSLSPRSRWMRFSSAVKPTERLLCFLTELDHVSHTALCAGDAETGLGMAVARYVRLEGEPGVAEFAVTVVDEHQRRGIGSLPLDELIGVARSACLRCLRGYVRADNLPMLRLLKRFGATVKRERGSLQRADINL